MNLQSNITQPKKKLLLTLTELILHELWYSRNKCEKEDIIPNTKRSIQNININMTRTIQAHYRHHKRMNDLKTFEEKFSIDNIICEVDYHKRLNLHLPP